LSDDLNFDDLDKSVARSLIEKLRLYTESSDHLVEFAGCHVYGVKTWNLNGTAAPGQSFASGFFLYDPCQIKDESLGLEELPCSLFEGVSPHQFVVRKLTNIGDWTND